MAQAMELSFCFSLDNPRLATVSASRPLHLVSTLSQFDRTANFFQKHLYELFTTGNERENSLLQYFSSRFSFLIVSVIAAIVSLGGGLR